MSGGASGLGGYVYQQDYVAFRVLAAAAAKAISEPGLRHLDSFLIEGRTSEDAPAWDIILRRPDRQVELLECKDTEIKKPDRRTFYRRVRAEIESGTPAESLAVGWVTDPGKQPGNILDHFGGVAKAIDAESWTVPSKAPKDVRSSRSVVEEALYYLCHNDAFSEPDEDDAAGTSATPPLSLADASIILRKLSVERWAGADLEHSMECLASQIFESGTGSSLKEYIRGHLTSQIREYGRAENTLQGLINAVGTLSIIGSVKGILQAFIRRYSAAAVNRREHEAIVWTQLPDRHVTKWELHERIPHHSRAQSAVIVARQGVGKTVCSYQAFAAAAEAIEKHRVLRVEAELLQGDELSSLEAICTLLSGLGPTWLAIDGLDAISRRDAKTWQGIVDRLLIIPNLTVLFTAREEVIEAGEWLQVLLSRLPNIPLVPIDARDVALAFTAAGMRSPTDPDLIEVLRNPFVLSLYARIATLSDMPLEGSGEITAFRVVETFWSRRVRTPSEGLRAVGSDHEVSQLKLRAAEHIAIRTREGELTVRRPLADAGLANGVQMLVNEGVVLPQGSYAVRWTHDWFREFSLVDLLLADLSQPGVAPLADAIAALKAKGASDHVVRSAVLGATKWVAANLKDRGPLGAFIAALQQRLPGETSDALALLMEGSEHLLDLSQLPGEQLLEAVMLATRLRARQWASQITNLPDSAYANPRASHLLELVNAYEVEVVAHG